MAGSVTCPTCGKVFKYGPEFRIHLITTGHGKRR